MKTITIWLFVAIFVTAVLWGCSSGGRKRIEPASAGAPREIEPAPAAENEEKSPAPVKYDAQTLLKIKVAEVTIDNLRTVLSSYHEDTLCYPDGVAEKDDGNVNMVLALHDEPESMGGRGGPNSPYYEFKETDLKPSKHMPGAGVFVDPWGTPWRYVSARDSAGNMRPGIHNKNSYDLWSCGPNRKDEKGAGDDITNWK